jgi:hypothetical protein
MGAHFSNFRDLHWGRNTPRPSCDHLARTLPSTLHGANQRLGGATAHTNDESDFLAPQQKTPRRVMDGRTAIPSAERRVTRSSSSAGRNLSRTAANASPQSMGRFLRPEIQPRPAPTATPSVVDTDLGHSTVSAGLRPSRFDLPRQEVPPAKRFVASVTASLLDGEQGLIGVVDRIRPPGTGADGLRRRGAEARPRGGGGRGSRCRGGIGRPLRPRAPASWLRGGRGLPTPPTGATAQSESPVGT